LTEEEAREYQRILSENGIAVWSIGSPLGKVNIDIDMDEYIKTVEHVCKLANIFQTTRIRMFSFFHAYEKKEKVFENLRRMAEVAVKYGVELYHENEKDIYGDTVERVLETLENVPALKAVYDPANFIQVGEDADKSLNALHAKTDYFHVKDVIKETGELVPAGYGAGKIDELIARIDKDVVMTLEPHLAIFDAYKSIDDTEMKHKFHFESNDEAFDAAVSALKALLVKAGYTETTEGFVK